MPAFPDVSFVVNNLLGKGAGDRRARLRCALKFTKRIFSDLKHFQGKSTADTLFDMPSGQADHACVAADVSCV